jgi:hypothetical protein
MDNSLMYEDFKRVGPMEAVAVAPSRFVESLAPSGRFVQENKRWVYRPNNFVTFQVQPKVVGILITLIGRPDQFRERAEAFGFKKEEYLKRLDPDRGAYSRYQIKTPDQLLPAAQFIKWAFENSKKSK